MSVFNKTYISGCGVSYTFPDGEPLFSNLNFSAGAGITGIVGPNGSGKSTLLGLVSGALSPSGGRVSVNGRVAVLDQNPRFLPGATVAAVLGVESALAALTRLEAGETGAALFEAVAGRWDLRDTVAAALTRMGAQEIGLERKFTSLSGGEAVKVRLAGLLVSGADIILLDEPTNNMDARGRAILASFLRGWKGCALVVSHDRELLEAVSQILELSGRGLAAYGGNYSFYAAARAGEDAALERDITSAREDLKREQRQRRENLERQARRMAGGARRAFKDGLPKILQGARKRRAQETSGRAKLLHEGLAEAAREKLDVARSLVRGRNEISVDLPQTEVPNGKLLVTAREYNFRYSGGNYLFGQGLGFSLAGPARVAIAGPNGCGKSTLLKLIMSEVGGGECPAGETAGKLTVHTAQVAYLDQKLALLDDNRTLLENLTAFAPALPECERRLRLARFLFREREAARRTATLSGGERIRLALACVLSALEPPHLLLLDEPTNNLDIDSVERLESALGNYRGALAVVSHDAKFIENIGVTETLSL